MRKHPAPWLPCMKLFAEGTHSQRNIHTPLSLIELCELPSCTPEDAGHVLSPWALTWYLDLNLGDFTYEK